MGLGPLEVALPLVIILLIFGIGRFGLLRKSFIKSIQAFNASVKGKPKE